jgi:hypothetical protein
MKLRNFLLPLAALLIGCTDKAPIPPQIPHYKVYVDMAFSVNHKIEIAAALGEWSAKTSNLAQFETVFVNVSKMGKFAENTIYIYSAVSTSFVTSEGYHILGTTKWFSGVDFSIINVLPGIADDELFNTVILHELGHAMRLGHYMLDNPSVMHPGVYSGQRVECADLNAFCGNWKCSTDCDPTLSSSDKNIVTAQAVSIKTINDENGECILYSQEVSKDAGVTNDN